MVHPHVGETSFAISCSRCFLSDQMQDIGAVGQIQTTTWHPNVKSRAKEALSHISQNICSYDQTVQTDINLQTPL